MSFFFYLGNFGFVFLIALQIGIGVKCKMNAKNYLRAEIEIFMYETVASCGISSLVDQSNVCWILGPQVSVIDRFME